MSGKLNVYTLGQFGVNRVKSPLQVKEGELLTCQNAQAAIHDSEISLKKRDGMAIINSVAAAGSLLKIQNIPIETWQGKYAAETDREWHAMCWSPELSLFACVTNNGTGDRVITSPDGITWTSRTSAANLSWSGLAWSPTLGMFVAVAESSGGGLAKIMTSTDGITWTSRNAATADVDWEAVAWSPALGMFAAVSESGVEPTPCMTSVNGTAWSAQTAVKGGWRGICWGDTPALFVAVGYITGGNASAMTSPDGVNWTERTTTVNTIFNDVIYATSLGLFVAVGNNALGSQNIMTSSDGTTWTGRSLNGFTDDLWAIGWDSDDGYLVALGTDYYWTSIDGITWTASSVALRAPGIESGIAWSSALGRFATSGTSGVEAFYPS